MSEDLQTCSRALWGRNGFCLGGSFREGGKEAVWDLAGKKHEAEYLDQAAPSK